MRRQSLVRRWSIVGDNSNLMGWFSTFSINNTSSFEHLFNSSRVSLLNIFHFFENVVLKGQCLEHKNLNDLLFSVVGVSFLLLSGDSHRLIAFSTDDAGRLFFALSIFVDDVCTDNELELVLEKVWFVIYG